jgi:hypothetical protein
VSVLSVAVVIFFSSVVVFTTNGSLDCDTVAFRERCYMRVNAVANTVIVP